MQRWLVAFCTSTGKSSCYLEKVSLQTYLSLQVNGQEYSQRIAQHPDHSDNEQSHLFPTRKANDHQSQNTQSNPKAEQPLVEGYVQIETIIVEQNVHGIDIVFDGQLDKEEVF